MKKFILLFAMIATLGSAFGQGSAMTTRRYGISGFVPSGNYVATATKTLDTCTNMVDTVYFFANASQMIQGSFQLTAKLISGTGVITAYLERSADGVSWFLASPGDTINLKPAASLTRCAGIAVTINYTGYYRWRCVGHNTAAVQLSAYTYKRRD
jgi:hypothetical protein